MLAWYVALTIPNLSSIAERHLKQQAFEVFNPKEKLTKYLNGRSRVNIRQYIPGYIFMRFDVDDDCWFPINWTRGIRRLVAANPERPVPVSDEAMSILQERVGEDGFVYDVDPDESWLQVGVKVRVCNDPLMLGIVQSINGQRAKVMLPFISTKRPVDVGVSDLEAWAN